MRAPRLDVRWQRVAWLAAAAAAAMALDRAAWVYGRAPEVMGKDWYQVLRQVGYAPTWLVFAAALWMQDRGGRGGRPGHHRAGLIALAAVLPGLLTDVLKVLGRRMRPGESDGWYAFRAWTEQTWTGSGLGLPSGHAATAFGGMMMVALLFPRVRWLALGMACGCGVTRVLAGAHYFSDVVMGGMVGAAVAMSLFRAGELEAGELGAGESGGVE